MLSLLIDCYIMTAQEKNLFIYLKSTLDLLKEHAQRNFDASDSLDVDLAIGYRYGVLDAANVIESILFGVPKKDWHYGN